MASFPTSIVSPTDPQSTDKLSSPSHSQQHQSHNAEIVAVETKIGTGSSTPTANTILKATGTGTSAWGTLTSANVASIVTDETGSGVLVFGTSPTIGTPAITSPKITTAITDSNGNEIIRTPATGSAVNDITVTNAATGGNPLISATGDDASITLDVKPKGASGIVEILDNNGNEVIKTGVGTASAVNEYTITNAATANNPTISATGGDSNISVNLVPKGTGNVRKAGNPIDWELLGTTVLGSAGDTISVTPITAKKHLRVYVYDISSGGTDILLRFNNDAAANYASRYSVNGGADTTSTSATSIVLAGNETSDKFAVVDVVNVSTNEKLVSGQTLSYGSAGAGSAPTKWENTAKWANTAAQITRVDAVNDQAGDFNTGSTVWVWGHD